MSEPEITVQKSTAYVHYAAELAQNYPRFREELAQFFATALDPNKPKSPPPVDPGPNPQWLTLVAAAAANPVLAELVELHKPVATVYPKADGMAPYIEWLCHGDEANGYEAEYPDWPCETTAIIARHLGVDLGPV